MHHRVGGAMHQYGAEETERQIFAFFDCNAVKRGNSEQIPTTSVKYIDTEHVRDIEAT